MATDRSIRRLLCLLVWLISSSAFAQTLEIVQPGGTGGGGGINTINTTAPLGGGGSASTVTLTCAGCGGAPGGSTTQLQYNNAGVFSGITGATTNGVALTLVAPNLGTPASGVATNLTGLPLTTGVTGILPAANGGTGLSSATNNTIMIGNGTTWVSKTIPDCQDTGGNHLNFQASTNAVSCGTSGGGGGGGSGTVTSVASGAGLTGGPITTTGTLSINTGGVTNAMLAGSIAYTKLIGTDITTVGTLTAGTWNATTIGVGFGGTGQTTYTKGDLLCASAANTLMKLNVGADGTVATADTTQTCGIKWGTITGTGTVTSVAESFTGGLISVSGSPITTSGTFGLTVAGTSGGIPYFSGATTWASSGALAANLPVIGGGAGVAPSVGTRSGNTTTFVTTTGTQTSGNCVSIDVNGNHVPSGVSGCGGTGISGLTTGTIPKAASATTLADSVMIDCGSNTVSVGSCAGAASGQQQLGTVLFTDATAPGTPASGLAVAYVDLTNKVLMLKEDGGVVTHTVSTTTAVANNFLTGLSDGGSFTIAQPSFANLSGVATFAQTPQGAPSGDDQVFISSSSAAGAWKLIPDCLDTGGQHINYTAATNALSCGTSGGGGGSPGGSNTQVQFNNASVFGGITGVTSNGTTMTFAANALLATTPLITTGLKDSAGNIIIAFNPINNAVNYLEATNNAAGTPGVVFWGAKGASSNIDLNLFGTGTGVVKFGKAGGTYSASWDETNKLWTFGSGAFAYNEEYDPITADVTLHHPGATSSTVAIKAVATQFDMTTTTLTNVTGLTYPVQTTHTYKFVATLYITASVTGGSKFAMQCTCTASAIIYQINLINNSTNANAINSTQTALGGSAGVVSGTADYAVITGTITTSSTGNLTVQFAENTASGTSSVLVGSDLTVVDAT